MLKKPASFVLDSSKSSTYPRGYASGFNSPAALLSGLFEHPAKVFSPCSRQTVHQSVTMSKWFSRNLSDRLRLAR
jgi:hypothetical protein